MSQFGPHLLGRLPSPPDERDWKLAPFLGTDADIVAAAEIELRSTKYGYLHFGPAGPPSSSHWAKAFALLAQIGAPTPPPPPDPTTDVIWTNAEPVLDQLDYGTCEGNGWAQWGNTLPIDDKYDEADARQIYFEATIIDGSPDDPDAPGGGQQGATTRAGVKAMKNRGRLAAYAFASSIDEVRAFLRTKGPVVFGTDWTSAMFSPNASGYIEPQGSIEGGHAYVAVGDLPGESAIKFINSWGSSWGLGGYFKMKVADVAKLLGQGGEAVAAVELP